MKQLERIAYFEERLDRVTEAARALEGALEAYTQVRPLLEELEGYYGSREWRRDYAADEAGRLPPELKRGVLSEDGIDDALARDRELLERMEELAAGGFGDQ